MMGSIPLGIQEGIVLLQRWSPSGLEPVRIVSGSPFQSPLLHGVGYIRGNIRVQRKPSWIVARRVFAVSLGRYFFITSVLKTSAP